MVSHYRYEYHQSAVQPPRLPSPSQIYRPASPVRHLYEYKYAPDTLLGYSCTEHQIVMEQPIAYDVVDKAQSVGDLSPVDATGLNITASATLGGDITPVAADENTRALKDDSTALQSNGDQPIDTDPIKKLPVPSQANQAPLPNGIKTTNNELTDRDSYEVSKQMSSLDSPTGNNLSNAIDTGDQSSNAGDNHAAIDDSYQHSAAGDIQTGSDTDNSKSEHIIRRKDPDDTHSRSNSVSVKKHTSFKSVSVTKNYLAKTGVGASQATKGPSDKSLPTSASSTPVQPAARPRLVAKSGSKDPRTLSGAPSATSTPGPDASTVWNRNRPTPTPQPKQFTDEELKQQYGIHMATRLQADEAGQKSKWADLDDDDDDWAPETVEWMDGTKSTIRPKESAAPATKQAPQDPTEKPTNQVDTSEKPGDSRISIVSAPGKAILRPGARTSSTVKPGLVLRSAPEAAAAEAKPTPSPSTNRSPWASLPPVDKAPPITFNPPAPQVVQGPNEIEPSPPERKQISPGPAKEIAADDFNRTSAETERTARDLFNPQSGRYEPARGGRRLSKAEGSFRAPEVLQRPLPRQPERSAPEEAVVVDAIQTQPDAAEPNTAGVPPVAPAQDLRNPSPGSPARAVAPLTYSAHGPRSQQAQASAGAGPTNEDDLAVQQKLMREKIEFNRRRKQEEEERERIAREQRIKARLEALGPAPPKSDKVNEQEAKAGAEPIEPGDTNNGKVEAVNDPPNTIEQPLKDLAPATRHGASMVPVRPSTNEPTAELAGLATSASSTSLPSKVTSTSTRLNSSTPSGAHHTPKPDHSTITDQDQKNNKTNIPVEAAKVQTPTAPNTNERSAPPPSWNSPSLGGDSTGSWSRLSLVGPPNSSANVWGPLTNDKSLGNGAFESRFQPSGLASNHQQPNIPQPGPIGPPPASSKQPGVIDPPVVAPMSTSTFDRHQNEMGNGGPFGYGSHNPRQPVQADNAPRSFGRSNQRRSPIGNASVRNAWGNFSQQLIKTEHEKRSENHRALSERLSEQERSGIAPRLEANFFETPPTDLHEAGGRAPPAPNTIQGQIVPEKPQPLPSVQLPIGQTTPHHAVGNTKPSRFFGPAVDKPLQGQPPSMPPPVVHTAPVPVDSSVDSNASSATSNAPSGASLDTDPSVEAYDDLFDNAGGAVSVRLPPRHAVVKLPPAAPSAPTLNRPVIMPSHPRAFAQGAQAIVNQAAWQDRFNGLLKSTPRSPPQARTAPVARPNIPVVQPSAIQSSTAVPFETMRQSATVSLPRDADEASPKEFSLPDENAQSKPCIEELMDDRELGSTPTVNIPSNAVYEELSSGKANFWETARLGKYGSLGKRAEVHHGWPQTAQDPSFNDSYVRTDPRGRSTSLTDVIVTINGRRIVMTMSCAISGSTLYPDTDRSNNRRPGPRDYSASTSNMNNNHMQTKRGGKQRAPTRPANGAKNGYATTHATAGQPLTDGSSNGKPPHHNSPPPSAHASEHGMNKRNVPRARRGPRPPQPRVPAAAGKA